MAIPAAGASFARIKELDGLRGLAILFVLLGHLSFPTPSVQKIVSNGWMGVDLFFVLSGYLITGILLRQRTSPSYYRNFYMRRTLRIFPAYYLVLIAATSAYLFSGYEGYENLRKWGSPLWFVFFLGNFRQAALYFWPSPGYFSPLWSVQVEEQFYLVFPYFVKQLRVKNLGRLLVAVALAVPVLRSCIVSWGHASPLLPFVLTFCRADSLAMGALIAVYLHNRQCPRPGWWLDVVVAGGFVVLFTSHRDPYSAFFGSIGYTLVAAYFATVLLWTLSRAGQAATALFRYGPLPRLGLISYGVYLWHEFAFTRLSFEFNSVALDTLIQFVKIGGAIAVGLASWHFIEKPFQKRKEQYQ